MSALESDPAPDLAACEQEPIHIPGAIQPHGALLVLDPESLAVVQASANAPDLLAAEARAGVALHAALGDDPAGLETALRSWRAGGEPGFRRHVRLRGRAFWVAAHDSPGGVLLEFEPAGGDARSLEAHFSPLRSYGEALQAARDLDGLCALAARQVRALSGFDRALVYRFDPAWNGHVIGEDRNEVLPSYLGLRWPASDIPRQARELYRLNRLRLIAAADYTPSPVLPAVNPLTGGPLDLSLAGLRSVSPVHLEYMRNMGTGASMSVSIVVDGELWGLVSCHNRAPRTVALPEREACEFAVQMFAMQVSARSHAAQLAERETLDRVQGRLLARMTEAADFVDGLAGASDDLLAHARATGAVIISGGRSRAFGVTPEPEQVERIVRWLDGRGRPAVVAVDSLAQDLPEAEAWADRAAGLLAVSISELHASYVLWFRPEQVRTVAWGGDPRKPVAHSGRIHPRQSFEAWKQVVRLRAEPWTAAEVAAARQLREAIVGIVMRAAEELAEVTEELRRMNRELESFSYSISHDLRAPFRHIVGYSELLRERDALDATARHYIESIVASAIGAGRLVDDLLNFSHLGRTGLSRGRVNMNKMMAEVRASLALESEGREIDWRVGDLPEAWGDQAMIRQALLNLVGNAVKYTRPRTRAEITVGGDKTPQQTVFWVTDNGVGFDMAYAEKMFGVFQRLQRAEDFEGTGIGLALVQRIVERHKGRVWAEGAPDRGATFWFALPNEKAERNRG
jgi:light-regulated signal transduction histidine kinase (bacteriophytochrome)